MSGQDAVDRAEDSDGEDRAVGCLEPKALQATLEARRSVRRFKPDPVPRALLGRLVAAAVTAPSASNKQPWRFLIVTERARIEALASAVRKATERVAAHVEASSQDTFRAYGDYFVRFEEAPALVIVLCRRLTLLSHLVGERLPERDRGAVEALERDSGLIGASMALQNLLLMAPALGLGASGMTGPLLARGALRDLLGVKPSWKLTAFVPVGYPDEAPPPTARKSHEKVIRWLA